MRQPLRAEEVELIFKLAERLTGADHSGSQKREILVMNVMNRMDLCGCPDLVSYLSLAENNALEFGQLLSALTIHSTQWFRESSHFDIMVELALEKLARAKGHPVVFRVWSAACSTGQEAYSAALVLERLRRMHPQFEYLVYGSDIDPVSVEAALSCRFRGSDRSEIPAAYQGFLKETKSAGLGTFSLDVAIKKRCAFKVQDLIQGSAASAPACDVIFIRNVLIYFSSDKIMRLLRALSEQLVPEGCLILGHSECFDLSSIGLKSRQHACYVKDAAPQTMATVPLRAGSESRSGKKQPLLRRKTQTQTPELIMLGASTGGIEALSQFIAQFPQPAPPILLVQHIGPSFAQELGLRLAALSGLQLGAPTDRSRLEWNHLYMALGDYHIGVAEERGQLLLTMPRQDAVFGCRPSVDVLFRSAVPLKRARFAALFTGMGKDGASSLLELRKSGALTAAQSEASSLVFGMPKEAIRLDAADFIGSPQEMRAWLLRAMQGEASAPMSKAKG